MAATDTSIDTTAQHTSSTQGSALHRTEPDNASTATNLASSLKPAGDGAAQVKPCCVCKDEKAARDECMLFSNTDDPQKECQDLVGRYRSCMKGYGFALA